MKNIVCSKGPKSFLSRMANDAVGKAAAKQEGQHLKPQLSSQQLSSPRHIFHELPLPPMENGDDKYHHQEFLTPTRVLPVKGLSDQTRCMAMSASAFP